jgi:homoserine kinase
VTRVRVPASIANLGPGFDVLAMAVDIWLEVDARPAKVPQWTFEGEGAEVLAATPNPLSRLRMRGTVVNEIPLGVGLGSSAAARVAAQALLGNSAPWLAAAEEEGHPDNAAAAALGGVVMVLEEYAQRLPTPDLEVALLVADDPQPTEAARAALTGPVSRADAIYDLARLAALVNSLHTRDYSVLTEALEDRLHQPQRRHLYPWTEAVISAALSAGGLGSAICGAGPSVFAFARRGSGHEVAEAMANAAEGKGRPLVTRIADAGLRVG